MIRTISAIPFRVPLGWFLDAWTLGNAALTENPFYRRAVSERLKTIHFRLVIRVNNPLARLFNQLWGKDGKWHSRAQIEHWPAWLQ